jgi:hypothetical protein
MQYDASINATGSLPTYEGSSGQSIKFQQQKFPIECMSYLHHYYHNTVIMTVMEGKKIESDCN